MTFYCASRRALQIFNVAMKRLWSFIFLCVVYVCCNYLSVCAADTLLHGYLDDLRIKKCVLVVSVTIHFIIRLSYHEACAVVTNMTNLTSRESRSRMGERGARRHYGKWEKKTFGRLRFLRIHSPSNIFCFKKS